MVGPLPKEEIAKMSGAEKEKYELKEQLRVLRGEMSGDLESIGTRLNVVQRFQNSFRKNQNRWLLGGLITGSILAFSSSRRSFSKKAPSITNSWTKNLFLGLLGMTTKQIIKQSAPSIANYLQKEIGQRATTKTQDSSPYQK